MDYVYVTVDSQSLLLPPMRTMRGSATRHMVLSRNELRSAKHGSLHKRSQYNPRENKSQLPRDQALKAAGFYNIVPGPCY